MPSPNMDRAVTLRLPSNSTARKNTDEQGGTGGQGHRPHLAEEIIALLQLTCEIPPLLPCRRDLLSQRLPNKGTPFHIDLKTLRLAAWKLSSVPYRISISESAIKMTLTATRDTTRTVYKGRWNLLLAGVVKGAKILFARLSNIS